MLGEGFLRVLRYREERKIVSATKIHRTQTQSYCMDPFNGVPPGSNSGPYTLSTAPGPNKEELGPTQSQGLSVVSQTVGVSIPGCSPVLTLDPNLSVDLDSCSLLQHYPDLRLGQETGELGDPPSSLRGSIPGYGSSAQPPLSGAPCHSVRINHHQQQQGELGSSVPDQGYLVMGASVTTSLDLPGSGLEPMSNSVLNGLLEKQLEEVYLQHLTDSLARCNSHLGNSLLHGLVPPPQPSSQRQGPDSLEAGLEDGPAGEGGRKISYLSTQNLAPCSSNFSSPMLRISEAESAHLQ
ncbi:uncharacterized protein [Centroberyx affinis]|uniref:uncharacterized protein n=1 Tax=Centroberyx affinis TaxID=166261 RepID=UPI003A5BF986